MKRKFRVGQVVSFRGSKLIFVLIHSYYQAGLETKVGFYRDGIFRECDESDLRPLTKRERGKP